MKPVAIYVHKKVFKPLKNEKKWLIVSVYWKSKKNGKTWCRLLFVNTLPTPEESRFKTVSKDTVALIFLMFKKHKTNPAGLLALNYICINSPKGTTYKQQGLYRHHLESANSDVQALERHMTKDLSNYYKYGPMFPYNNHFDKYIVDWDIKCTMEEWLGANYWEDVTEQTQKALYKDYPRRELPDWSTIVRERY